MMYCPRCANVLITSGDTLYCDRGNTYFSEFLSKRLSECFESKIRVPDDKAFNAEIGGVWYCPSDGSKISERNGVLRCPSCKLSLNEFIYQLVERHSHTQ